LDPCRYTCDTGAHFVAKITSTGTICVCDEANGYVLEWKQCKLKINECAKRWNIAPTMSWYIFWDIKYIHWYTPTTWTYTWVALNLSWTAVVYTWNAITYTGSSALEPCTYTCDEANGYEKVWNTCKLKVKECTTWIGNIKPTMSWYIFWDIKYTYWHSPTSWTYKWVALNLSWTAVAYTWSAITYTGSSILEPCTYTCDSENGYDWNTSTRKCELWQYECKWTKPTKNGYFYWSSKYNYWYTPTKWTYVTGSASNLKPCQYTCNVWDYYRWNWSECVEWKYTVVYNSNGWTPTPSTQTAKCGTGVKLASAPTNWDYNFAGWRSSLDNKLYNPATVYTWAVVYTWVCNQTITMTAEWSRCKNDLIVNPNGWKVKFNGTEIKSQKNEIRDCGRTITLSVTWRENVQTGSYTVMFQVDTNIWVVETSSKEANYKTWMRYPFIGWMNNGTCGTISDWKYRYPISDATTCTKTAKWWTWERVVKIDEITLPKVAVKDSNKRFYTFSGWYTKETWWNRVWGEWDKFKPRGNTTLYAQWKEKEKELCTITYDANGWKLATDTENPVTVECGNSKQLAEEATNEPRYKFYRWQSSIDESQYKANQNYWPITQNVKMIALWNRKSFSCGEPYKCVDDEDGNKVVDGTNTWFDNHKYTRKCWITDCLRCDEGYKEINGICVPYLVPEPITPCNHCAKSWFPYCFPINFRESCNEDTHKSLNQITHKSLNQINSSDSINQKKCRVDTSIEWCNKLYTDADMAEFNEKSCKTQDTKWICKVKGGYLKCASSVHWEEYRCSVRK
jgi:hypothetical protein